MQGKRISEYSEKINEMKEILAPFNDLEQVGILHEIIDDTPYKTGDYFKYFHDEYYIVHNKRDVIENSLKYYTLRPMEKFKPIDLFSVIKNRSSSRDYINKAIPFDVFSNIIYYSFGVKSIGRGAYGQKEYPFKFINSQGGLNYLDLFMFITNVEGVEQGLYYYDFINNRICQMDKGNYRYSINEINFQNEFTVYGSFLIVIVADLTRVVPKYYKRAYRMTHVDTGIALSYMQLISEYMGLSSCIVAGYLEHLLEKFLSLTKNDYPIGTMCFGYRSTLNKNIW